RFLHWLLGSIEVPGQGSDTSDIGILIEHGRLFLKFLGAKPILLIAHGDIISGSSFDTDIHRMSRTASISRKTYDAQRQGRFRHHPFDQLRSAVGRGVIDDDDLRWRQSLVEDRLQSL